ncbi:MAG: family ATPase [Gammaproteobacteria bacterium]|jgi:intracellular multiplication protein IcmB|nr:family ATPase [Gammaproteobacteria bacterium]
MAIVDSLYDGIDSLFAWLSTAFKQNALSYCDLESADSKHSLVTKDGSLISIIKLAGYKRFVGANEFAYICERVTETFQPALSSGGHYVQFFFSYNKATVSKTIDDALTPARRTAKRLELSIDDIFSSRVKTLSDFCGDEECFIALWTTPESIEKTHLKRLIKQRAEKLKKYKLPKMPGAANLFSVLTELRNTHESFVSSVLEDLQHAGFYLSLLDVHKAAYYIRKSIDPVYTDSSWQPHLPGDPLPLRLKGKPTKDISSLLWPPLDWQLMPRGGENVSMKYARIGDLCYAPIFVELFPKEIKYFYELFRRLLPSDLPWRISYFMGADGIKITQSKNVLAQVLSFASSNNKLIADAHKLLKNLHERSDDPVIKLYVCLATWAPIAKTDLLKERAAKLYKAVQSWGNCEVGEITGDPFATTLSSALAVTKNMACNASAAPLSDAVYMLPIVRPASPWQAGALLFRTPDGKVWPYQPGSTHQVSWIDIVYARSGSGKSVLLNTLNLGLCLLGGLSRLPRISIVDIGPSSKGFISLLREGLPQNKKHEVIYHRLTMEEKDAINPFDTQLGARYPTRLHRSFLINFISLLLVESVEDRPPEGMASMISMIVDETYKRFSDIEQPKVYVRFSDDEIEKALEHIHVKSETAQITWWQVADALFEAGDRHLALKAQRYAMPTIADTVSIAYTNTIKDLFAEVKTQSNEGYIDAYARIISGVIRNLPTLTCVTRLDLEDTRVVALDLDEVAKSGSGAAEKQTAVMYMLARHILAKDFFLNADEVEKLPPQYHELHKARIKEIMEEPKRIVFDEFHRTSKSPVIRDQIVQDMREGRKWKIHIALSSQSLKDFDELMVEFATSVFILDSGSSLSIDATCKTFGLTDTERVALSNRVHGPSSEGATFIAQFVTKRGMNTQLLTSTISPVELWAFNTTTEDVSIRESLYKAIGPVNARKLLADAFPKGSATEEIEAELKLDPTITVGQICDRIIRELTDSYRKQKKRVDLENFDGEGLL